MRSKSMLLISVIIALFASMFLLPLAYAPLTVLSAPPTIVDDTKVPGTSVSIEITIDDALAMWGFEFVLGFDPEILIATGFEVYSPFVVAWPSFIDNETGTVAIAYSMEMGEPVGFYAFDPTAILRIDFDVVGFGGTFLDLYDSVITDTVGTEITHEVVDGFFANVIPDRSANLVRRSAWPEHHSWVESKDPDLTLTGKVKSLGNVALLVKVVFTITDGDGLWVKSFETEETWIRAGSSGITDLTVTVTVADLDGYGTYYVKAQCWFDSDGDFEIDAPGAKLKSTRFTAKP